MGSEALRPFHGLNSGERGPVSIQGQAASITACEPRWTFIHCICAYSGSAGDSNLKKGFEVSSLLWKAQVRTDKIVENAKQAWQFSEVRLAIYGWNRDNALA